VINDTITKDKLIEKVNRVGEYMKQRLVPKVPSGLKIHGNGTQFVIMSESDGAVGQKLYKHFLKHGIIVQNNCNYSIGFRPAMILEEKHVDTLVEALGKFQ